LIDFSLLELSDDLHIFFADRVIFEIIEFGSILREIQKINPTFMFFIEFAYVFFKIEIETAL